MPALYPLAQHNALVSAQAQLHEGEFVFAYSDDLYVLTSRPRARAAFDTVAREVERHAGVRSHLGKLKGWCKANHPAPPDFDELQPGAWVADAPEHLNGIKVLGTPMGSDAYCASHLASRMEEERALLNAIREVGDVQSAWLLLCMCAVPRANHLLRALPPSRVHEYALAHDQALWDCLCGIVGADARAEDAEARSIASLPARHGGLGLRSALRSSAGAYLAGWMDALPVIGTKLPFLREALRDHLEGRAPQQAGCIEELRRARAAVEAAGCDVLPPWEEILAGARAPPLVADDIESIDPTDFKHGWQFHACAALERDFLEREVLTAANPARRAMLLSQSGPGAGRWLSARPTSPATTMCPLHMQVAIRRRLRWPLPLGPRRCNGASCRRTLDDLGDHWASCTRSGRVRKRARPLEQAWARVFRESGARVQENVFLRDTRLPNIHARDGRRLEIIASGLPLHRGVPLGVDATLVSPLHADGSPWAGAAENHSVAIRRGEADKAATYSELVGSDALRLVTLACEVGGRWSSECVQTLRALATARARAAPSCIRASARHAWSTRWWTLLSVAQQSALAASLTDDAVGAVPGCDGEAPSDVAVWVEAAHA